MSGSSFISYIKNFKIEKGKEEDLKANVLYHAGDYSNASYLIPPNQHDIFIKMVADDIFKTKARSFKRVFNETGQEIKKYILDFDFKVPEKMYDEMRGEGEFLSPTRLLSISESVNKVLGTVYERSFIDKLELFIMKKQFPGPIDSDAGILIKDGLHMVIPELKADEDTLLYLRERLISDLFRKDGAIFGPLVAKAGDIVDEAILKKTAWMLYGCSKSGQDPYLVNYSLKFKDMQLISVPTDDAVHHSFVSRFKMLYLSDPAPFKKDFDEFIIYKSGKKKKDSEMSIIHSMVDGKDAVQYTAEQLAYYWQILDSLAPIRYEEYEQWIEIGFILSSISRKSKKMYDLWYRFSLKSKKKFGDGTSWVPDQIWDKSRHGFWNEGSLMVRLKQDNLKVYNDITTKNIIQRILAHGGKSWEDTDIAEILYLQAKEQFKMCSFKVNDRRVFQFVDHIWRLRNNDTCLRNFLRIQTKAKFVEAHKIASDAKNLSLQNSDDSNESEKIQEAAKKLEETISLALCKMRKNVFKRNVIDSVFDHLNDYDFLDNINKKHFKFAFKNGVLDGIKGVFADGDPDDLITQQCPWNYYKYDPMADYHQYFLDIDTFYDTIFPDPELSKYMKHLDARALFATTNDARTFIYYGSGQNGKTKKTTIFETGFGPDYYTEINVGCFTQTRKKSSDADSEKAKLKDKRISCTSEIGKNETVSMALVKEVTGGGQVTGARDLFQSAKDGTFQAIVRLFWQVNYLPKIDCDIDVGVERRLRVIKFVVQFVDADDSRIKKDPYHFKPRDNDIDLKIETWKEFYCSYLAHIYLTEIFGKDALKEPEAIKAATKEYLSSIDMLQNFKNDAFEAADAEEVIDADRVYAIFQAWQKQSNFTEKVSRNEILEYMKNRFEKNFKNGKFEGLRSKIAIF